MECVNCNVKIKDGSIYCPVCGKEARMVNGYTSLEDDFLHSLIREGAQAAEKKVQSQKILKQGQKRKQSMTALAVCCILAILIVIGFVGKIFIDYRNDNSYEYQMEKAEKELVDHNYENAMQYFSRALAIVPTDVESRLQMAEIHVINEEYAAASVLLLEAVQLDPLEEDAYQMLLDIYAKTGQYEQIHSLSTYAKDKEIQKLFTEYLVETPVLYPASDTFYTDLTVTIISVGDHPIYYTTDGTDPITNGKRYLKSAGIVLERSGFYTIRAVCKNENGIYSPVAEHGYQIVLMPPEMPKAALTEEEGMNGERYLALTVEEDCSIYYTWDGTRPTRFSEKYTEPIVIPDGENVLSAVAIDDKTGLVSEIYSQTFYLE